MRRVRRRVAFILKPKKKKQKKIRPPDQIDKRGLHNRSVTREQDAFV